VTCVFTNEQDAHIVVVKQVQGVDPGQVFSFDASYDSDDPSFALGNGQSDTSAALDPGTYSVSERPEANWLLLSAICSDGSDPGSIDLAAGETVICTFVNQWQVGSITIKKSAMHVTAPGGTIPQAVNFVIHDNVTQADIPIATDSSGTVCMDNFAFGTNRYTITEQTPAGCSADTPSQTVTGNTVSRCGDGHGVVANFTNTPLTNVTVSVDSQVDGATLSDIHFVDADGNPYDANDVGDDNLTVSNLKPPAPAVTLNCAIVVDP